MIEIGYSLSSEECSPKELVRYAQRAEEIGFSFTLISDHFHPWIKRQGQSPFVWSVIGALSETTQRLSIGTGVTCPILRIHPTIVAQAAATAAMLLTGRFFLGLGSGENLNEHVVGHRWPPIQERQEMLAEAVKILRLLWGGGNQSFRGKYFTVENAEIFSLPEKPPPLMIAAAGPSSAALAGAIGDGLISTVPQKTIVEKFHSGSDKLRRPCYGQMTVCWAESEERAKKIATEWWPVSAIPGNLMSQLATPAEFEAAAKLLDENAVASSVVCGPNPDKYLEEIHSFKDAGFDHIYIHQVGPDQEGFFRFYERELAPRMR